MNMIDLLQELDARGIALSKEGHALKVHGPKGAVTAELRTELMTHREALLAHFQESDGDADAVLQACEPDAAQRYEPFPMADLQLGFYMADDPYMDFHVRPHYYVELDGAGLDTILYQAAWDKALQRHHGDIVIVLPEGKLQTVRDPAPLVIALNDLRDLPADAAARRLSALREEMQRSELPLDRWPWIDVRVSLWEEEGAPHSRIHCNFNNFFGDGYSTMLLLQEIGRYYRDPALTPAPLSLGFRDAVLASERLAVSAAGQAAKRYWEERLPQLPGPPDFPFRAGMDRRCRSRLQRRKQILDQDTWLRFKQHAQQAGLTPSNAMFAVYAEIVAAWSNSRHFVLNNMMTRRTNIHPEAHEILGNFASLYPLEVDLRSGANFIERARRLQEQVMCDAQHVQWGGMQVMQALNRQKGSFGRAPIPFVVGSGLFMGDFILPDFGCLETSQVMLDFQFFEAGDGHLLYVWDLLEEFFPDGMIDDMWQAMADLMTGLARDAGLWQQACFDLVPARQLAERTPLALQPISQPISALRLEDLLKQGAVACPDRAALLMPDASLSYRELAEGAQRLAAALHLAGVRRGATVAVVADRGPGMLKAVYAILQAGAAYVPIDPSLPDERRNYLLNNCEARHVIADPAYVATLGWPDTICVLSTEEKDVIVADIEGQRAIDDLAYVIYTSGSTGRPKGVMIDHRGAMNTILAVNQRFNVGAGDRLFGVSSFGFDLSVYDIFGAVAAGASLVYPEPQRALDPAHWLDMLGEHRVTIWNSAPPLAALLVELAEVRAALLPELRLVMLSGDWIPVDLPDRIRRIAPNAQVLSLGGATEASIWSIWYPVGTVDCAWPSIPYGYPMPNQSWCVLDDWGRPVPEWTAGELYIGGIGLAHGYWKDVEKTAASFIRHPRTGEALYRTGDMGRYLPAGAIEFLGRKDTQVKIQGHRIELGEIESVALDHPGVRSAVAAVQKPQAGGSAQLVLHVVPRAGIVPTAGDLQEFLGRKLPGYMVPSVVNFLPHLPLNSSGKIDRNALPWLELQRRETPLVRRIEPLDAIEAHLLEIWRRVLKQDGLALTDDFFDCGGQSFEAVRVVGLIREALQVALSIGDIWEYRTIARLAERVRGGETQRGQRYLIELAGGAGRPLFLVHPAGGHVLCYRGLAQCLSRPVHAFQAPGVDGHAEPLQSIPAFAAHYLALLKSAQPHGPVLLGGWSSGGLIAYEMAVQLRAQGREVEGVIILDSPAPLLHEPVPDRTLFDWFIGDLDLDGAVCTALRLVDRSGSQQQQLERAAACLREHGVDLGADVEQLGAIYRVFSGIVRASRDYHPSVIDADMLVLRAGRGAVAEFTRHPNADREDWGWRQLSNGEISCAQVDATHYSLLSPSTADIVSALIERWLAHQ